jgi:Zn-finger nucleic acid-binding protein
MNCSNCGAAMALYETRGYFFCAHCGSFHFPHPPDDQGLRVLGTEANPPACPACSKPLAAARLDEQPVHVCQTCRGVLMPRATFADVVSRRRAWASSPVGVPRPLDRRELERAVTCPRCGTHMATHPYLGPGAIVIDTCETCDYLWLDAGELKRVVDAPGRDRGARDMPREQWNPPLVQAGATDPDAPVARRDDLLSLLLALLR